MSNLRIRAASYVGPEGHGNDLSGLRPWPAHCAEDFRQGNLRPLHWSLLLSSAPARLARMNRMCQLSLIAAELLEVDIPGSPDASRQRIGVCLETYFGALATDVQFLRTPRPTLFTYSLPSTVIGEICIHFKITGPSLCLISPEAAARDVLSEAADLVDQDTLDACLCLGCEVTGAEMAPAFAWPHVGSPRDWHACALLVSRENDDPRQYPFVQGDLREICRDLCMNGH